MIGVVMVKYDVANVNVHVNDFLMIFDDDHDHDPDPDPDHDFDQDYLNDDPILPKSTKNKTN